MATSVVRTWQVGRRRFPLAVPAVTLAVTLATVACGDSAEPGGNRAARRPHLGFLSASASPAFIDALKDGLAKLGYEDGRTIELDIRTTADEAALPGIAAELVARDIELLIAGGTKAAEAAKQATTTIPIVMANSGDPVATGLVEDMARPGANITGLTQNSPQLGPKRLEVLKEAFPGTTKVVVLFNPGHPTTRLGVEELRAAAPGLGIDVLVTEVNDEAAIEKTLTAAKAAGAAAAIVMRDPFTVRTAKTIAAAALAARLPAMYETRNFLDDGGLMLYGPDLADLYRRSAEYVDRILEGARPATMAIGQPTKFELVINLGVAERLGVEIPESVRVRADELID